MTQLDEEAIGLTTPLISAAPSGRVSGPPHPELRQRRFSHRSLTRRLNREFDRTTTTSIVISVAAAMGTAVLASAWGVPAWAGIPVCLLITFTGSLWLPLVLVEPSDRHLHFVLGTSDMDAFEAWTANFPTDPFPMNELAAIAWLKKRPLDEVRPTALILESALLMSLGRYPEALERLERVEASSTFDRFEIALMLSEIDYETGGAGVVGSAERLLEDVEETKMRAARAELAIDQASRKVIAGEPWAPPIDAAHQRNGGPSIRTLIAVGLLVRARFFRRRIAAGMVVAGLAVGTLYRLIELR